MPALALLQIITAILPLMQVAIPELIALMAALKGAAQQSGEWTPEQESAYRAALLAKTGDPAWKPDPPTV